MFSATFSPEIRTLAKQFLHQPKEVSVATRNSTAQNISQVVHPVDKANKSALLKYLVHDNDWDQVLVFVRTKHGANKLTKQLISADINAAAIHGNKSQGARTKALAQFKIGEIRVLVATDIAARGIDITELPHVVNYDLPQVPQDYVHRIGRTGRAGLSGDAVSLVSADEFKLLRDIERLIGKSIERTQIPGFEPDHVVPDTSGSTKNGSHHRPKKKKRTNRSNSNRAQGQPNTAKKKKTAAKAKPGGRRRRPAARKVNS